MTCRDIYLDIHLQINEGTLSRCFYLSFLVPPVLWVVFTTWLNMGVTVVGLPRVEVVGFGDETDKDGP